MEIIFLVKMSYSMISCVGSSERCWFDLSIKTQRTTNPSKRFLDGNVRLVLWVWIDVEMDFHMTCADYIDNFCSGCNNKLDFR